MSQTFPSLSKLFAGILEMTLYLRHFFTIKEECVLGKRSKSRRFIQHSADAIGKYDERIPYRMTYAESEERKRNKAFESSLGGV